MIYKRWWLFSICDLSCQKYQKHSFWFSNQTTNEWIRFLSQRKSSQVISVTCSRMAHGLRTRMLKKLIFELAMVNKRVPRFIDKVKAVGSDWLQLILHDIIQYPKCLILLWNIKKILKTNYKLTDPSWIFNLDETGTTIQNCRKGKKPS